MMAFEKLIAFFLPDLFTVTLKATIMFFTEARIWNVEYFCSELLKRFLVNSEFAENTVNFIVGKSLILEA